jgi:hypothetical protein
MQSGEIMNETEQSDDPPLMGDTGNSGHSNSLSYVATKFLRCTPFQRGCNARLLVSYGHGNNSKRCLIRSGLGYFLENIF